MFLSGKNSPSTHSSANCQILTRTLERKWLPNDRAIELLIRDWKLGTLNLVKIGKKISKRVPQTGKASSRRAYSICCGSSYGPTFGEGHDIYISSHASSSASSYSNLGQEHSPPRGHSFGTTFTRTFLAGSYNFRPDEIETFYETT